MSKAEAGKTQVLVWSGSPLSGDDTFLVSVLGGAAFAMASHVSSDQLVVQRLLACRSKAEAKAIIVSGVVVTAVRGLPAGGACTVGWHGAAALAELGLTRDDEIFPCSSSRRCRRGCPGCRWRGSSPPRC